MMHRFIAWFVLLCAVCVAPCAKAQEKGAAKPGADHLSRAQSQINNYQFNEAVRSVNSYLNGGTRSEAERKRAKSLDSKAQLGASMLDRVEKVQIIDSVTVPLADFWHALRMMPDAGRLLSSTALAPLVSDQWKKTNGSPAPSQPVYVTEDGDDVIWVGVDSLGTSALYESLRLADGAWDEPARMFDYQSVFGNESGKRIDFPFLMSDGVTLYFAADGDQSLGGLDIFISRRDEDGFLQPSNIGMPYNSPANDFLYAIDEETGVGYWVTDRNAPHDSVTVFTFIPQDLRINYPAGSSDIIDRARVISISATQPEDADYTAVRQALARIEDPGADSEPDQFSFALPGGRVATHMSDLSAAGAKAMERYLNAQSMLRGTQAKLTLLRRAYGKGDKGLKTEILRLESDIDAARSQLRKLANDVVRAESGERIAESVSAESGEEVEAESGAEVAEAEEEIPDDAEVEAKDVADEEAGAGDETFEGETWEDIANIGGAEEPVTSEEPATSEETVPSFLPDGQDDEGEMEEDEDDDEDEDEDEGEADEEEESNGTGEPEEPNNELYE